MDNDDLLLTTLFPSTTPPPEDDFIHYGSLILSLPSTQSKAITLLANQIFNPAFVLAEQMDLGVIKVAGKSGKTTNAGIECSL
jgi:hypothetical protein